MPLLNSSGIFFRKSNLFFLLVLICFLLVSGLPVEAQAITKKNATSKGKPQKTLGDLMKENPWSDIKGFRSAKFGIDEKSVYRAIAKDFKLPKRKVKRTVHPSEKTTALEIIVPELFSIGGAAKVGYILGHKSKKLMHVNVLWGKSPGENFDGKAVVEVGNKLRDHFLKKRYKEEGVVANGVLSPTQTILFRGKDRKNRMILLLLNTVGGKQKEKPKTMEDVYKKVELVLSYMSNPDKPDVRNITIKEDEF